MANEESKFADYDGAVISNIKVGKDAREKFTYARLDDTDGTLGISATVDYIVRAILERKDPNLELELVVRMKKKTR
jgi:hypothetical protein